MAVVCRFFCFLVAVLLFFVADLLLHMLDLDAVFADIETQVGVDAHVLIGDPDQREERDQVAAPVVEQQLVARDEQEESGYVMAEAEFAGKEKKELAAGRVGMALTLADAVLARLAKNFFMRDRPSNASDG